MTNKSPAAKKDAATAGLGHVGATQGCNADLHIPVQNQYKSMLKTTSIHWHGINLNGYNYADGTPGITQCPLAPGHSFLYEFRPSSDQVDLPESRRKEQLLLISSTFSASQACDGLRGPFVIYDSDDPYKDLYDVDNEGTVITLSDWLGGRYFPRLYHIPSPSLAQQAEPSSGFVPIRPDSTLINGLGGSFSLPQLCKSNSNSKYYRTTQGRYEGGPNSTLAVVKVEYGKRYRFRLISMSCNPSYTFSIDGHMFSIIEVDGEYTQPLLVDSLEVLPAQRDYACEPLLSTNSTSSNNGNFKHGMNSAILRYIGATGTSTGVVGTEPELSINASSLKPMREGELHPLYNPQAPGEPRIDGTDVDINLKLGFDNTTKKFTVNGQRIQAPISRSSVPVLLQILNGKIPSADEIGLPVYTVPANQTIQVSFEYDEGVPGGPRPWHLHGHRFSVVRSAGSNSSEYNFENPVRRDTVSTGKAVGDMVTVRWRTDSESPGPWLFHSSRIDGSGDIGMGVVFIEDSEGIAEKVHVSGGKPAANYPHFFTLLPRRRMEEPLSSIRKSIGRRYWWCPYHNFHFFEYLRYLEYDLKCDYFQDFVKRNCLDGNDGDGIGLGLNANIDLFGVGGGLRRKRRRHGLGGF
ncbi:Cupredoxin [Dendrothele bispora CBS 962.96]|uniref:laccase n=1 Tax=Dendrothele bispora (strain CBS 962.96) TaxID=1314807 RepID=A0A4V4HDI3_DENBC|nr:Cupredoxin [Dendrothele bispora CBS 962.96]